MRGSKKGQITAQQISTFMHIEVRNNEEEVHVSKRPCSAKPKVDME